jgi:hypothetical protein
MVGDKNTDKKNPPKEISGKLLGVGITSVIAGLLLFVAAFAQVGLGYSTIVPTVFIISFGVVLYKAFTRRLRSWGVFLGLYGFLVSLLFLLAGTNILSYRFIEFWPLLVFLCGVCLIAAGFYGRRRLAISYMIPAMLLIVLGIFFLLFSTDIIQITLSSFVGKWLPVGLIFAGITLVVLFFFRSAIVRQVNMFYDDTDDPDDLRDND